MHESVVSRGLVVDPDLFSGVRATSWLRHSDFFCSWAWEPLFLSSIDFCRDMLFLVQVACQKKTGAGGGWRQQQRKPLASRHVCMCVG